MRSLYPPIRPNRTLLLEADPPHRLHVEECGNDAGIPVVVLHGGPGMGCRNEHRRLFDPATFRIVLPDQRGAGRSTPRGSHEGNTTAELVADLEQLREHLGIERWMLFGESWGATLALRYAVAHPRRVLAAVLHGTWLPGPESRAWMYGERGAARFFPGEWQDFVSALPASARGEPLRSYAGLLESVDEVRRMAAARAWAAWHARLSVMSSEPTLLRIYRDPRNLVAFATLQCHYVRADGFVDTAEILENARTLADVPVIITHGRFDMASPPAAAVRVHEHLEGSRLRILPGSGHACLEPAAAGALVRLLDQLGVELRRRGTG